MFLFFYNSLPPCTYKHVHTHANLHARRPSLWQNLEVAATWMSQWLANGAMTRLANMLHAVCGAGDMEALVQATCTGMQVGGSWASGAHLTCSLQSFDHVCVFTVYNAHAA
jgi:hypothetical protein